MNMNLGINVVEVDGATPSIQGAPTSVAGFVIRSQRGVPGAVRQVSNFSQFLDYFGGFVASGKVNGTQTSYVGAYALRGFFDNGGSIAYVTRVVDRAVAVPAARGFALISASGPTGLAVTAAFRGQPDPGTWGNSVAIAVAPNPDVAGGFDLTVASVSTAAGVTTYKILETWTKLVIGGAPGAQDPSVINDPNTGSKYVMVSSSAPAWAQDRTYAAGDLVTSGANVYVATTGGKSATTGSGPTGITGSITDGAVTWAYVPPSVAPAWQPSTAYTADRYVSTAAGIYRVTTAGTSATTGAGPTGTAASITDGSVTWAPVATTRYTALTRGADDTLTAGSGGTLDTALAAAFTTPSPFDPYPIQLLACPETAASSVVKTALTYCENRGDCMFVGHAPDGGAQPLAAAKAYGRDLQRDKAYGAVYMPFIQVVDPIGTLVWIPPTGHVLGVYARTDQERGVWKAPAGDAARVNGALAVRATLTDADHTDLVKNGSVNAIRPITGAGIVIDSSRTLSTNALWLYVNVRLLFNYVKTSLKLGLRWVVQEPNNQDLWSRIKYNAVTPFLLGLWRRGAFGPGASADVFAIKVDGQNNPPDSIQKGILNVEVTFYPSRPAETIVITVGQQEGGAKAIDV
jgi:phage tail sheath protein FI